MASISISGVSQKGLINHSLYGFQGHVIWLSSTALDVLATRPACHSSLASCFLLLEESLPYVPDAYAIDVSDVPGYGSRVHIHDHGGSKAPDESSDSILSSEPKPLGKYKPPHPPSILSPGESSYPL
ncbi:hypothetical protein Tco_0114630 [Tanacetum coccineum]